MPPQQESAEVTRSSLNAMPSGGDISVEACDCPCAKIEMRRAEQGAQDEENILDSMADELTAQYRHPIEMTWPSDIQL